MKAIMLFSILALVVALTISFHFSWTHAAAKKGETGLMSKDLTSWLGLPLQVVVFGV